MEELPVSTDMPAPAPVDETLKFEDGSSSELSELDEDVIMGDIEPDHYYEGGRVPVFKPTMDQFRSFSRFIEKINKYGMKSGIVKVIPPTEWRDSLPKLDEAVKTIKVKNPIRQEFNGNQGIYRQLNMEQPRSYNLPEWRQLSEAPHHQPPARRGERRRNQDQMSRAGQRTTSSKTSTPTDKRKAASARSKKGKTVKGKETATDTAVNSNETILGEAPPTPTSPKTNAADLPKTEESNENENATSSMLDEAYGGETDTSPMKGRGRQPKSVSSRRKNNKGVAADVIDEAAFTGFDYRINDQNEYTAERCEELEKSYWKGLTYSSPLYGADMPGSLFEDTTTEWNVAKLDNLLNVIGQKVPGVNTAYLYLGMWKSTFAWHLEDVDLYSINYIHFGAPKQWYSISQEDARRFEAAMRNEFPEDAKKCGQFLRHKSFLISPSLLQSQYHIKVNRLVHHEGEFVITFPYGYHSGYNIGYNCAESVNFATPSWLDYGRIAKKCECESDSVWIDVGDIERKLRGEETEFEETDVEMEDDEDMAVDLPTPPESIGGKFKSRAKKRKDRDENELKVKVKRIRVRVKEPQKELCTLCPNNPPHEKLLPTDNGKQAHALCALYIPETYISEDSQSERICNVSSIDKARMGLKCYFCRSVRGACFQCSSKKCVRAYHATCAAAAGVLVDRHDIPVFLDDGKEYKDIGVDFRCRFHRVKRAKQLDGDQLEADKFIVRSALKLAMNEVVQMQQHRGDIFAGRVLENRKDEQMLLLSILPNGAQVEVEYKWLLAHDPADSYLPYPSDSALPLPADQARKAQPQQTNVPQPGDPFGDADSKYTWTEFEQATPDPKAPHVKVDLSKCNKLWHYLGAISTESRQHYTEDPEKPVHNTQSSFLGSIKEWPDLARYGASLPHNAPKKIPKAVLANMIAEQNFARSERPYVYRPKEGLPVVEKSNGQQPPQYSQPLPEPLRQRYTQNFGQDTSNHPTLSPGCQPFGHQSKSYFQSQQAPPRSVHPHSAAENSHVNRLVPVVNMTVSKRPSCPTPNGIEKKEELDDPQRHPNLDNGFSNDRQHRLTGDANGVIHRPSQGPPQQITLTNARQAQLMQGLAHDQSGSINRYGQAGSVSSVNGIQQRSNSSLMNGHRPPHMTAVRQLNHYHNPLRNGNGKARSFNISTPVFSRGNGYFARQDSRPSGYQSPYSVDSGFTLPYLPHAPPKSRQPQQGIYSSYEQFWQDMRKNSKPETPSAPQSVNGQQKVDGIGTDSTEASHPSEEKQQNTPNHPESQPDVAIQHELRFEDTKQVDDDVQQTITKAEEAA